MNFTIDPEHLCSVSIKESGNIYKDKDNPTEDDLFKLLQGKGYWSSVSYDDHPEFKMLREQLGSDGYIEIQRSWWNGDCVLNEFYLNGAKFTVGEKFPSGAAIKSNIDFKIRHNNKCRIY